MVLIKMLEILQAKNKENYREKISQLNLDFKSAFVVEATDEGNSLGYGIYHFAVDEDYTPIVEIDYVFDNSDILLLDGIIRSVLFLAMMRNVDKAKFGLAQTDEIAKLGFVQNNYNYLDSIAKFMSKCKSCKN